MNYKILSVILCFFLAGTAWAQQDGQTEQKQTKAERKAVRQAETEREMDSLETLLASRAWIIEANLVFDRRGQSHFLDPSINFLGVNGEDAAIQFGFNHLIGWNGLGGVTLAGRITSFDVKKRKEGKPARANLRFMGRGVGSANITITVGTGGQARADVYGDFGERFSFSGRIVPVEASRVYQGQSLF